MVLPGKAERIRMRLRRSSRLFGLRRSAHLVTRCLPQSLENLGKASPPQCHLQQHHNIHSLLKTPRGRSPRGFLRGDNPRQARLRASAVYLTQREEDKVR
jgi:hypothetical protein